MGNEIVAVTQFREHLYIFTRSGEVWRMYADQVSGEIMFSKFANLFSG